MCMENAPTIILFWYFGIAIILLMIAWMIMALVLIKKGKGQSSKRMQFFGKICMILSIICSVPISLVVGYILYIYIT